MVAAIRQWTATHEGAAADVDLALEAARNRRDRRARVSTGMAILARGTLLLSSLAYIPLTISYLGTEAWGVFVAMTSLNSILVFADLGLGNGLLNVVSDANGREDDLTAARAVSSALFMLIAVAALLLITGAIAVAFVPWDQILHVSNGDLGPDLAITAGVVVATFAVALPLGVVDRTRMAFQEGYINSVAAVFGTIAAFIFVWLGVQLRASLPVLILAIYAPPIAASVANGIRLFVRDRPWLRPQFRRADRAMAIRLARVGFLFFVLQVAVSVAYQSDILVAATVLGPDSATIYAVTLRVFMLVPSLVGLYLVTLWPAYTEALARGDIDWVRRTLRRSIVIAVSASSAASAILLLVNGFVLGLLTGGRVAPPTGLLIGVAIWAIVSTGFNAASILLNAASIVRFQVIVASIMAATSLLTSIVLARWVGVSGIIWGTLLAYLVCSALPIAVYLPRLMGQFALRAGRSD